MINGGKDAERKKVPFLLKGFTPKPQTRNLAHVFTAVNHNMRC